MKTKKKKHRGESRFARMRTHALVIDELEQLGEKPIVHPRIVRWRINDYWTRGERFWNRSLAMVAIQKSKLTVIVLMLFFSSCATLFTPKATDHQKHKPACGEPKRQLRPGAFALDLLLFPPALIVDFATGKIYKPEPGTKRKECSK